MFGGNGHLCGFTISHPKYHEGPGGLDLPPPGFNGCPIKILSTFLGISIFIFTRFIPLGVYGLNLILAMVWAGAVVNGT
jgi:hypothetical protein